MIEIGEEPSCVGRPLAREESAREISLALPVQSSQHSVELLLARVKCRRLRSDEAFEFGELAFEALALRRCTRRRAPIRAPPVFLPFFCEPAPPLISCPIYS